MADKITLSFDRCPHGVAAIALNNETAGTGTRLTPDKCCGRWETKKAWQLGAKKLLEIAEICEDFAEVAEPRP